MSRDLLTSDCTYAAHQSCQLSQYADRCVCFCHAHHLTPEEPPAKPDEQDDLGPTPVHG